MGFWDSALKMGKEAINEVKKIPEEIKKAKAKYASYSDERLLSILRDNSNFMGATKTETMAAASVLHERGYDAETIRMLNSQK